MSVYRIEHDTRYVYHSPVATSQHVAWLEPRAVSRQVTRHYALSIEPAPLRLLRRVDYFGNVVYRHTAQNFNPVVASAGRITVVEVEEIVAPGELEPTQIHTPGIYVDRVILGHFEKRIEKRTVRA